MCGDAPLLPVYTVPSRSKPAAMGRDRRLLTAAEADLSIVAQDAFVALLARRIGAASSNFMMKRIDEVGINALQV